MVRNAHAVAELTPESQSKRGPRLALATEAGEDRVEHAQIAEWTVLDRMSAARRDIDRCLDVVLRAAPHQPPRLIEAMRYATLGGGKRMRGLLTVLMIEMLGGDVDRAIWIAAAIECVHTQSLVHDDLPCMDDDDLRRGRPSLHRQFDEATAVLAGDALLALAFEMLASPSSHADPLVRSKLVLEFARSIGKDGLALGQMIDLYPPDTATADTVTQCEELKTGNLLRFCAVAACLVAGGSDEAFPRLVRFADRLGLAFQIRDDILDCIGNEREVGKRLRKDRRSGRRTAVDVWGLEGAQDQARMLAAACHQELAGFGGRAQMLGAIADFAVSRSH